MCHFSSAFKSVWLFMLIITAGELSKSRYYDDPTHPPVRLSSSGCDLESRLSQTLETSSQNNINY